MQSPNFTFYHEQFPTQVGIKKEEENESMKLLICGHCKLFKLGFLLQHSIKSKQSTH